MESNAIELAKLIKKSRGGEAKAGENEVEEHNGMIRRRSRNKMFTWKDEARESLHLQQAIGNKEVELHRRRGRSRPVLLHRPHLDEIWILNDFKGALLVRIRMGTRSFFGSSDHGRRKEKKQSLEEETMEKSDGDDGGGSTKLGFGKI